jgi:hypothetical protein
VAQEWDPQSLPHARDGGTGCYQESWSLQGLQKAQKAYNEAKKAIESARAGQSLLNGTGVRSKKFHKKKALSKAKEATKEALAKAQDSKSKAKEADEVTKVTNNMMKAGFQEDLEKAKQAQGIDKGAMTAAASQMFTFYSNFFFSRASTHGTRSSVSRQKATCLLTYKVSLWKAQGECLVSCLTTASCFTFSLRFPFQLSKKSTTFRMYLRIPSASTYISLYVM